ncbi:MAG TPA: hypothetical protein EYP10_12625, partial [Armatimonadetes bacterium]|nr:hypothetical protein [Armatimonadota bacterium]
MLHVGIARVKITPPVGTPMMGYAARDHGCEGIHDDLYAKVLVMQQRRRKIAIIGTDLGSFDRSVVHDIKKRICADYGFAPKNVLINNSHTHAGPAVARRTYLDALDESYISFLIDVIPKAVGEAWENRQRARLFYGLGETKIGISRRRPTPQGMQMRPNPKAPVDTELPVLLVTDDDGAPIAIVFSIACHPSTMGADNYLISAEWSGVAQREIERQFDDRIVAIFLQGAGGDVKPRIVAHGTQFRSGTFEDVERVGKRAGRDVMRVVRRNLEALEPQLCTAMVDASLPLARPPSRKQLEAIASDPQVNRFQRRWAEYQLQVLRERGRLPRRARCYVQLVKLARNLRIVALEGEVCTGIGRLIKRWFGDDGTIVLGYTNGSVAYLPTRKILQEGGYEAMSFIYFGLPAP